MRTYNEYTTENYNEAIQLYAKGERVSRIAKILNIPRSTVKGWIFNGKKFSEEPFRKGYTDQDIIDASNSCKSMAGMLKILGLKAAGGNYDHMRKKLKSLDLKCEHWSGQGWNKDQQLKDWGEYKGSNYLKKHIISLKGHKCEDCNLSKWKDGLIPLELHHKDGNRCNNMIENIQILCCNCHAFTSNYRNRKTKAERKPKIKKTVKCLDCENVILYGSKRCRKCEGLQRLRNPITKIVWPTDEELQKLVWEIPTTTLALRLGVSDQAIIKRCGKRGIKKPARGYWSKLKTCQS